MAGGAGRAGPARSGRVLGRRSSICSADSMFRARRRELDRERHAVKAMADRGAARRLALVWGDSRAAPPRRARRRGGPRRGRSRAPSTCRPSSTGLDRLGDRPHDLGGVAERLATGGQDSNPRAVRAGALRPSRWRPRAGARSCPQPAPRFAPRARRGRCPSPRPGSSGTPRAVANVCHTSAASATGAELDEPRPVLEAARRLLGDASARRVLPLPPGPWTVTRRSPASSLGARRALARARRKTSAAPGGCDRARAPVVRPRA